MYLVKYIHNGLVLREECIDPPEEIRKQFAREGKTVISVQKKFSLGGVPVDEVIAFLTAMGDQAGSGVHMTQALDNVITSFRDNTTFPAILKKVRESVANGNPIATAMGPYQHIFGHSVLAMVEAGEHSGQIGETFLTSADFMQSQQEINRELWQQLIKPAVTFGFGITSLVVNATFVIPRLLQTELFKMADKGKEHDMGYYCIRMLTGMSYAVPGGIVLVILIILAVVALYKQNQEEVEKKIIMIPSLREFIFCRAYFVAFSSLSKLVEVGVPLGDAFEIVEKSTGFITLRRQFAAARAAINDGQPFTDGLTSLSAVERSILHTAQDQVRIHKTFADVAKRYHRLYLKKVRSISPKVQTLVIILVVAIFLLEFLGIMLPYAKILNSIH